MFVDVSTSHLIILLLLLALEVYAIAHLWQYSAKVLSAKVIWTIVIVILGPLGAIGYFFNWALGKLTERLNRRAA